MARVSRRSASVYGRRSPSRIARRNARKHKVIMESVTQEKKKLRSVISFEARAPRGYTFIPAGNPHLTTACKELCRKDGLKVFAVTTTPHMHTHNLSQHVHRIGYHFPSAVVATVCMDLGLYLTAAGKAVPFYDIGGEATPKHANSEVSQITINTEARDVLKDLFPNIPDNDLNQIIKTAFQKGQRKVGTAVELPLARRAQLAVVAHIRHIYTEYDRLLKSTSFHEARSTVEQPTLAKLVEWRGDDENGRTVLEDVFREVIVISDDEDSDVETESLPLGRDYSVEVVSSHPRVEELQTQPVNYAHPTLRDAQVDISEDEAPPGFRFIPEIPKKKKNDRRGFSRYQAWDRAINQYRKVTHGTGYQPPSQSIRQPLQENIRLDRERRVMEPRQVYVQSYPPSNLRPAPSGQSCPPPLPAVECRVSSTPSFGIPLFNTRNQVGSLAVLTFIEQYELYPVTELPHKRRDPVPPPHLVPLERGLVPQRENPSFPQGESPNAPVFVSGPRDNRENAGDHPGFPQRPPGPVHARSMDLQDRVLPSIESPLSTEIKRPNSGQIELLTKRISGAFSIRSVTPHHLTHQRPPPQDVEQFSPDHAPKRRRMAYHHPPPLEETQRYSTAATPADAHSGERYTTFPQLPIQDPHIRRRYAAPVDPIYITDRQPMSIQGQSTYTTRFNLESHAPHTVVQQGPIKDHEGKIPSCGYLELDPRRRSPEHSHRIQDTRNTIPIDNGYDRVVPAARPPDPREPRAYHKFPSHSTSDTRPLEPAGLHSEPAWRVRSHDRVLVPYKAPEKARLYADDFVRTIDLRDSPVTEHPSGRRPPTSHVAAESPPQPANFHFHKNNQHHRELAESARSNLPRGRVHLDPHPRPAYHGYQVASDCDAQHPGGRLFKSSPTTYLCQKRCEDGLAATRKTYELHQRIPYTEQQQQQQQRSSPYTKRTDGPRYAYAGGRAVMIMD